GYKMLAGTILVVGDAGTRIGTNMLRGTIILFKSPKLMPIFYYNCYYQPAFWGLLYKDLQFKGFDISDSYKNVFFKRFSSDANEGARGEVLICQ
ncbi:MAG: hypothetical protein WCR27_05390, partial [Eubacteriales bacterium]